MQLYWHGYSSVRIEAKSGDTEVTLLTDPYENEGSLRFPKTVTPDVLVLSHQDTSKFNLEAIENKPFIITDPGEYEIKGAFVQGVQDLAADPVGLKRPVLYRFVVEGMTIGFLGKLNRELTDIEVELLGDIDILLLPVGGGEVMTSKIASKVIRVIEPRMVIPLYFDIPGIKTELETADAFCQSLGVCTRQDSNKLKISRKDLPQDELVVTVLEKA